MDLLLLVTLFVCGSLLGSVITYLVMRSSRAVLEERLQQRDEQHEERAAALSALKSEHRELADRAAQLRSEARALEVKLEAERRAFKEKKQVFAELEERFSDTFKALSGDALKENSRSFIELANELFKKEQVKSKGELERRKQAIEALLKPINESLKTFGEKVGDIEKSREGAYQALKQQVIHLSEGQKTLTSETGNLVRALNTPHVRGSWGELQLRKVVELAGMTEHCDFEEQQSKDREDLSRARPDMIIHLPGDKQVIVDAKAPMVGFLAALEAESNSDRKARLRDHARHIRAHIKELGERSYWEQFENTPEFVVLFLPGESFFSAALEVEPTLIDVGVQNKVILATPTTLIALLKVVAYGWRQESLAVQAQEISQLGKQIYERVADLANNWMSVGKGLRSAVEHYNKSVYNLESKVLVSARKFKQLPIELSKKDISESPVIELEPRNLQAPELEMDLKTGTKP